MTRLIDADALKKHYAWWEDEKQKLFDSIVDSQPTVDAVPVRHGKWTMVNHRHPYSRKCSVCGMIGHVDMTQFYIYCPNCGARMDEE